MIALRITEESIEEVLPEKYKLLIEELDILDWDIGDLSRSYTSEKLEDIDDVEVRNRVNKLIIEICADYTMRTDIDCELIYAGSPAFGIDGDEFQGFFGHEIYPTQTELEHDCYIQEWEVER